jgi:transposase-like protein
MKDELKRNFYVKEVAEKYDVYENLLFRELERALEQEKHIGRSDNSPLTTTAVRSSKSEKPAPLEAKIIPPEERDILKLILEGNPDVIRFVLSNISLLQLSDERTRKLAQLVLDLYDERGTIDAPSIVSEVQEPALKNLITDLVLSRYELSPQWEEMEKEIDVADPMMIAKDAVVTIRRKVIQKEMEENQHALKEASSRREDATPYLQRQQELLRLKKEIESL